MKRKLVLYGVFGVVLITGFLYFVFHDQDMSKSLLAVRNPNIPPYSFTDQNGKTFTNDKTEGKVYVAEFFFTTCKGICPRMNANMRRVFDLFKDEPNFMILSHTCMPETDSVPLLKAYEQKMINSELVKTKDGSYEIADSATLHNSNPNWYFLTGDKKMLYKMAREAYQIDNDKPDPAQNIADQFIHTQFFALVDNQGRVRGMVYDGLNETEVQQMITDIKGLLKEKVTSKRFMNGFNNNPN